MSHLTIPRKEAIVIATIDAINKSGIQAVSTKEIAKSLNISESLIFKYYPKKKALLFAVLEHFSQYDEAIKETARTKELSTKEAILYFFNSYSSYYENYPEITAISQSFDVLRLEPELAKKTQRILESRSSFIQEQLERAKQAGKLQVNLDCEVVADILMGALREACLKWRINKCNFSLKDRVLAAITFCLDTIKLD